MSKPEPAEKATTKNRATPDLTVHNATQSETAELYTIGDLAHEFGLTLRTLRFYEDKGLLNPEREGRTRLYSEQDREKLHLIVKGKRLGFTLVEISEMIADHGKGKAVGLDISAAAMRDQIEHLERQRQEIDEALAELRQRYNDISNKNNR